MLQNDWRKIGIQQECVSHGHCMKSVCVISLNEKPFLLTAACVPHQAIISMPICFVRAATISQRRGERRADKLIKSGLLQDFDIFTCHVFPPTDEKRKRLSHYYVRDKSTLDSEQLIFSLTQAREFNVRDIIGANGANMRLVAYLACCPIWMYNEWALCCELKTRIRPSRQRRADRQLIVSLLRSLIAISFLTF